MQIWKLVAGGAAAATIAGSALAGAGIATMTSASTATGSSASTGTTLTDLSDASLTAQTTQLSTELAGVTATKGGAAGTYALEKGKMMCDRIPNLLTRSTNLETKLAADASTKGSIAWLEAKIAVAQAAGKTQAVTTLTNRLAVRKDLQALLPARVALLKQAQSGICVDIAKALASSAASPSGAAS